MWEMWLREGWSLGVWSYCCRGKLVESCCFLLKMQVCCPSAWPECPSPDPKCTQLKYSSSEQVITSFLFWKLSFMVLVLQVFSIKCTNIIVKTEGVDLLLIVVAHCSWHFLWEKACVFYKTRLEKASVFFVVGIVLVFWKLKTMQK